MQPCVYILATDRNGTLYIGVTSNLAQRITQHKNGEIDGFTKKYSVHRLVWYEYFDTMLTAIEEEKRLKEWNRQWKLRLIDKNNPYWKDLSEDIMD